MFDTLDEAVEMNSVCAFCKKPKFMVMPVHGTGKYELVRDTDGCAWMCQFDHTNEQIQITDDREAKDILSIASGWGAR